MGQSFEFYAARAKEAAAEASAATLENVRERNLRAAAIWNGLADRAKKTHSERIKRDAEKEVRAGDLPG